MQNVEKQSEYRVQFVSTGKYIPEWSLTERIELEE